MTSEDDATDAVFLSRAIHAFASGALAGHPPEVQSAALADLTATWLAGFQGSSVQAIEAMRAELFALYIRTVLDLVPVNEAMLRELRDDRQ